MGVFSKTNVLSLKVNHTWKRIVKKNSKYYVKDFAPFRRQTWPETQFQVYKIYKK